jgi:hypothetical protein
MVKNRLSIRKKFAALISNGNSWVQNLLGFAHYRHQLADLCDFRKNISVIELTRKVPQPWWRQSRSVAPVLTRDTWSI